MALRGHILTQPREIGGILTTVEHQKKLAVLSRDWNCPICGVRHSNLIGRKNENNNEKNKNENEYNDSESIDKLHQKTGYFKLGINDMNTENLLALAENQGMKKLNLLSKNMKKLKKVAKLKKEKNKRSSVSRRLLFSIILGFSIFIFQTCFSSDFLILLQQHMQ